MLGTVATITISWALAFFISQVFIEHSSLETVGFCFTWLAAGGFTKALVAWMQELLAIRAAASVKQELRRKYFDAVETLGPKWLAERSAAEINLLATSGLDSLEPYFAKYLPQLVYTAMVTPVLLAIIALSDLSSGITLLVTVPLIPVFMILIGWATRSVQQRQLESLTRLSQHFLEVLRGLTTLKIFNRVSAQEKTLKRVSREHRERTMKVLRVSFLSGFALELISSLAVALVAVSIGLRLLSGDLTLMVGLFVLLLAPEAFLPLRQVGAHFHASAEGVAAAAGILDVIEAAAADKLRKRASITEAQPIQYAFTAGELTVFTGPSGIGKSTMFKRLLGFDGENAAFNPAQVAWLPQTSHLFAGSVAENIVGPIGPPNASLLGQACALAALDDLDLNYEVGVDGSNLSGGQAQRVCLARAFYRALDLNVPYLLLDEPISALDEKRANRVIKTLREFAARHVTVVAITHQKSLIDVADRVIEVK